MVLPVIDRYGAPSYGAIGMPPAGMVFHTPEWGTTPVLQSAIDCAVWQAGPGNTSGGSYHGLLGHDSATFTDPIKDCTNPDHWTMVRSVPWNMAAGGLSGNHTPPPTGVWAPDRYPWIRQMLPTAAFNDPNRWMHQISLGGAAAWYVANGYPLGLKIALAKWIIVLEDAYGYDALITLHRFWQTNRSDPGPETLPDEVLVEYFKLKNPPVPVPPPPTIEQLLARIAYKDTQFDAAGAAVRSLERVLGGAQAARIEAIRVPLRAGRNG